jgi:ectoine hydroxylase-related dioxygenase (phytanoyl-CoA dioxygenase family)
MTAMPSLAELEQQLDESGFIILEDFIDDEWLRELQLATERQFELEGENAGLEFKQESGSRRLANLFNKGDVFRRIVAEPQILKWVEFVLGSEFKLSSLNARSANAQNETAQPLHADMGAIADDQGYWVCNTVWMLDDFTSKNGPLRVVPTSHRWRQLPQDCLSDPQSAHPEELVITGKAGTVVVMNAHAWHAGMANQTDQTRTAIHAFFARSDKPQQQYQKQLLDADLQATLTVEERRILALDDPENDRLSAGNIQRSGFLK